MRNISLTVSLFMLLAGSLFAQQSGVETFPTGYARRTEIKQIQALRVAPPAPAEIQSVKNGTYPKSGDMYIIGLKQPADLDVANSGKWTAENDRKTWRIKIKSEGAQALELLYSDFYLPEGAEVFVYNSDFTHKSRPYTGNENPEGKSFATEAISGDEIILEYSAPAYVVEAPVIRIEGVVYIFRSGDGFRPKNAGQNGDSESCEVNVNCSEGTNWQEQKRGVAKIIVIDGNSAGLCTGSLLNNTGQDCKNYFMTAQHCGGASTTANLNQWTFYFNFESPNCANLTNSQANAADNQTMTGCARRASSGTVSQVQKSDFLLVEINGTIPSSYNVFYNGWDRNNTAATGGVGIHHPAGDIKKISTYTNTLVSAQWNGQAPSNSHWRVTWAATTNGNGVTEGGSSGSPIFNQNKRVVGDLSGGGSLCTSTSSPDLYGKFSYSWDQAGTTNTFQLKPWLDANSTNVTTLDGRNACNITPAAPVANFTATPTTLLPGNNVNFTQTCTNNPTSFAWTITPNTGIVFQSGTNTSSPNPVVKFNTTGLYTVSLTATNANGSGTETKTGYILVYSNAGVEQVEFAASVKVYPNPATESVNIRFETATTEPVSVHITDILGKTVLRITKPAGTDAVQVPVDAWAQGIYQLEITSGGRTTTQKIIKN